MDALKATNVAKSYSGSVVLTDFSLTLAKGDFAALMGPSGSGKSTFLHIAAGLLKADAGKVEIGSREITAMGDSAAARFRRRNVGVVFQAFNLLPGKTVRENILLPLRLDGAGKKELESARPRFDRLVGVLGLGGLLDRIPDRLSGGEKQRVAIARALIASPSVVLADEPTGNLDAGSTREICALFKSLNETEESAFLVVTHDPAVAASAKKVYFLKDGALSASCGTEGGPSAIAAKALEAC